VFLLGGVLLLPIILTSCFRQIVLRGHEEAQKTVWAAYRGFGRLILAMTVACWWVIWDWRGRSDLISLVGQRWPGTFETPFSWALLFWVPLTVSLGIFLFQCYTVDKTVLQWKWTVADTLRQAWWRLVSFVIPLFMVAAGFDSILEGRVVGVGWLFFAGVVARIGTGFLRRAEGMKFNALKSGELRNRALSLANRMGVTLRRVYVVPAGKGHLTNAYGMSNAITLTDNLGKYLTKVQIDYVIAHELAHVKLKHGRKQLQVWITVFSTLVVSLFLLRQQAMPLRPLLQFVAIVAPLIVLSYCSRRFEYSADKEAVDFTGDPETAIRALASLHKFRELPEAHDRLTEMFMTHPTFAQRVQAIAKGHMPADRVANILEDSGVSVASS
jgi:Zn-dependent protease with chaperone function